MLSFLGVGAVGASTLGAQSGFDNPVPSTQGSYWIDNKSYVDATPMVEDRASALKRLQDDLFGITSDPAKWIANKLSEEMYDWRMGYSSIRYDSIDPDIRNMKSITETAKMRMYFERRVKRQHEVNKTHLTNRIAEYMGLKS
jgi:hypothetical protein